MERPIWHPVMGLDGYIAGRDDGTDWVCGRRRSRPSRNVKISAPP